MGVRGRDRARARTTLVRDSPLSSIFPKMRSVVRSLCLPVPRVSASGYVTDTSASLGVVASPGARTQRGMAPFWGLPCACLPGEGNAFPTVALLQGPYRLSPKRTSSLSRTFASRAETRRVSWIAGQCDSVLLHAARRKQDFGRTGLPATLRPYVGRVSIARSGCLDRRDHIALHVGRKNGGRIGGRLPGATEGNQLIFVVPAFEDVDPAGVQGIGRLNEVQTPRSSTSLLQHAAVGSEKSCPIGGFNGQGAGDDEHSSSLNKPCFRRPVRHARRPRRRSGRASFCDPGCYSRQWQT